MPIGVHVLVHVSQKHQLLCIWVWDWRSIKAHSDRSVYGVYVPTHQRLSLQLYKLTQLGHLLLMAALFQMCQSLCALWKGQMMHMCAHVMLDSARHLIVKLAHSWFSLPHSFHVQVNKKRHIGNDMVCVVFLEGPGASFNPAWVRSHFIHCYIVVQHITGSRGQPLYKVAILSSARCVHVYRIEESVPTPDFRVVCVCVIRACILCSVYSCWRVVNWVYACMSLQISSFHYSKAAYNST